MARKFLWDKGKTPAPPDPVERIGGSVEVNGLGQLEGKKSFLSGWLAVFWNLGRQIGISPACEKEKRNAPWDLPCFAFQGSNLKLTYCYIMGL